MPPACFRLDHVFVGVGAGAPELSGLTDAGFEVGPGRRHVGQGTENRCVFFASAYLELLWLVDADEARAEAIRRTGLAERLTGSGAPLGICVASDDPSAPAPFHTWAYRPPYLPEGAHIPIADPSPLDEPLIFVRPPTFGARPSPGGQHPNGAQDIRHVTVVHPRGQAPSPGLAALAGLEGFAVEEGEGAQLVLRVDAPGIDVVVTPVLSLVSL